MANGGDHRLFRGTNQALPEMGKLAVFLATAWLGRLTLVVGILVLAVGYHVFQ